MHTNAQIAIEHGLTAISHLRLIELLDEDGPIIMGQAAKRIGLTSASITQTANLLEKRQLVERYQVPGDRRSYYLRLQPKGRRLAKQLPHRKPTTPAP